MIEYSEETLKQLFPIGTIVENNGYKEGLFKELEKIYIMENLIGTQLYKIVAEKETTDDYVSREKVEYMITSGKYANENYEQFIDRLVRQLKNLPSLTSTRKIGKWKQEYLGCMYDVCSECRQKVTKGFFKYNFCPNCGSDMRESED
jgi:hypothetical protein